MVSTIFASLRSRIRRTLNHLFCLYFLPKVTVKLTRKGTAIFRYNWNQPASNWEQSWTYLSLQLSETIILLTSSAYTFCFPNINQWCSEGNIPFLLSLFIHLHKMEFHLHKMEFPANCFLEWHHVMGKQNVEVKDRGLIYWSLHFALSVIIVLFGRLFSYYLLICSNNHKRNVTVS